MDKKWLLLDQGKSDLRKVLLKNRGVEDPNVFFHPHLNQLSPSDKILPQIEVAVKRIKKAIEEKELIYIYGDFDVDGITATAILWETIDFLGGRPLPYIPHREKEGYGIHGEALEELGKQGAGVVISVDCGITAVEEAQLAKKLKIDFIITDHHLKQTEVPEPFALLHTEKLSGSGIAFILAKELLIAFGREAEEQFTKNLELAAIGTIADMVPLTGDNRIIVTNGLLTLLKTNRLGLKAIYQEAGVNTRVSTYEVGFVISPRLNSTGRMESALDSLRLLLTRKKERATQLAEKIAVTNKERQQALAENLNHARGEVEKDGRNKMLVVTHESYYPGVIGLVASRLVEEFYRPTLVVAASAPISKGSGRSVSGFHITDALSSAKDFLTSFGGHPMAAGFSLEKEKIGQFKEKIISYAEKKLTGADLVPTLKIDTLLPSEKISLQTKDLVREFEPFGIGNPEPTFQTNDLEVVDVKGVGENGKHAKLVFRTPEEKILPAIGFGFGGDGIKKGDSFSVAYNLIEDSWQGAKKIQLKIKGLKKAKASVL